MGITFFELLDVFLKISQLLMTEWSPVSPVEEEHGPFPDKFFRQVQLVTGRDRETDIREAVTGVEPQIIILGHKILLF